MTLQDELHRIADGAPVADVPDDTWDRGRQSLHRSRALTAAAAVAVLALVGGLVVWSPRAERPPVAGSGAGVPSRLYDVPGGTTAEPDLAVGAAAAAFVSGTAMQHAKVVVVGADDGAYHVLDLPQMGDSTGMGSTLALSPDGTEMAYYARTEPGDTSLRIVDLRDGAVTRVPLPTWRLDLGTLVTGLTWSPTGRWLLWTGQVITGWTQNAGRYGHAVAGRVQQGATTSETLPAGDWQAGGIADDGSVAVVRNQLVRWNGDHVTRSPLSGQEGARGTMSTRASGRGAVGVATIANGEDGPVITRYAPTTATAGEGDAARQLWQTLGWIDDDTAVVATTYDAERGYDSYDLGLLSLDGDQPYRSIGTTDTVSGLTVATALMTPAHPTVDRPVPDWVDDGGGLPRWAYALGVLALVLLTLRSITWYRTRR